MEKDLVKANKELNYYINTSDNEDIHVYRHGEEIDKADLNIVGFYKYDMAGDMYGYYLYGKLFLMEIGNGNIYNVCICKDINELKRYFIKCTGIYEATDKMLLVIAKCYYLYMREVFNNHKCLNDNVVVAIDKSIDELLYEGGGINGRI